MATVDGAFANLDQNNYLSYPFRAKDSATAKEPAAAVLGPQVISSTPAEGATGISINTAIQLTFDQSMLASTINNTNITVNNGVTGSVSYNANTKTATFTPSVPLSTNTVYTVTVSQAVTALIGSVMQYPYKTSFQTTAPVLDLIAPTITNLSPSSGALLLSTSSISFDVTDNSGNFSSIVVAFQIASTEALEIAHDGTSFTSNFSTDSTRTAIANGYHYVITKRGGWTGNNLSLKIYVVDQGGNTI